MVSSVRSRPSHYEILGLPSSASDDDIAQAFADRIRKHLRPRDELDQRSRDEALLLTAAYETLSNPLKRRAYDASLVEVAGNDTEPAIDDAPPSSNVAPFFPVREERSESDDSIAEPRHDPTPAAAAATGAGAAAGYSVAYLARKHNLTRDEARELIERVGNDREKLNAAARELKEERAMDSAPAAAAGVAAAATAADSEAAEPGIDTLDESAARDALDESAAPDAPSHPFLVGGEHHDFEEESRAAPEDELRRSADESWARDEAVDGSRRRRTAGLAAGGALAIGAAALALFLWPDGSDRSSAPARERAASSAGTAAAPTRGSDPSSLGQGGRYAVLETPSAPQPGDEATAAGMEAKPDQQAELGKDAPGSIVPPAPGAVGGPTPAPGASGAAAPAPSAAPPPPPPMVALPQQGSNAGTPAAASAVVAQPVPRPAVEAPKQATLPKLVGGTISRSDNAKGRYNGIVTVRFVIGTNGQVTSCRTVASSGNGALDAHTCRLVQERLQFQPARDANGDPINWVMDGTYMFGRNRR